MVSRRRRQPNRAGTIVRRKDGRFEAKVWMPTLAGSYKRVSVYARTWDECYAKYVELLGQAQRGFPVPAMDQNLGDYLGYWLENVARPKVRPLTYRSYEMYVRRHLVPGLGRKKLSKLTPRDVRVFLNAKRAEISGSPRQSKDGKGLSPRTLFHVHAVLRNALEHAVREDLIVRNVAKQVQVSPGQGDEPEPWSVDEVRSFLKAVKRDRLYPLYAVAVSLGLRRGEALGLRWVDIDTESRVVRVRQTLQRHNGRLQTAPPKTRRSRRTMPLPSRLGAILEEHRERQDVERIAAGGRWVETGLVFTSTRGTPIAPDDFSRTFTAACRRAGVRRIRLHDLRHTCASLLLAQGESPRLVMEILGHSALDMTMNVYGHVVLDAQRDALRGMDDVLFDE